MTYISQSAPTDVTKLVGAATNLSIAHSTLSSRLSSGLAEWSPG